MYSKGWKNKGSNPSEPPKFILYSYSKRVNFYKYYWDLEF